MARRNQSSDRFQIMAWSARIRAWRRVATADDLADAESAEAAILNSPIYVAAFIIDTENLIDTPGARQARYIVMSNGFPKEGLLQRIQHTDDLHLARIMAEAAEEMGAETWIVDRKGLLRE